MEPQPFGVHRLCYWSSAAGPLPLDAGSYLENAIAALGGTLIQERWKGQVATYHQIVPLSGKEPIAAEGQSQRIPPRAVGGKDLYMITLGDDPDTIHLVVKSEKQVMAAASSFKGLLEGLGTIKHRSSLKLEGSVYTAGDFKITLARATHNLSNNFKGFVIDVAYLPLITETEAGDLLSEVCNTLDDVAQELGGKVVQVESMYEGYGLPEEYGRHHLAVAYTSLTGQL